MPRIRNILALVLRTGSSTCYPAKVKHRLEPNLENDLGWNENDDGEGRNRPHSRVLIVGSQLSDPLASEKAKYSSLKQKHLRRITVTSQAHIDLYTFLSIPADGPTTKNSIRCGSIATRIRSACATLAYVFQRHEDVRINWQLVQWIGVSLDINF